VSKSYLLVGKNVKAVIFCWGKINSFSDDQPFNERSSETFPKTKKKKEEIDDY